MSLEELFEEARAHACASVLDPVDETEVAGALMAGRARRRRKQRQRAGVVTVSAIGLGALFAAFTAFAGSEPPAPSDPSASPRAATAVRSSATDSRPVPERATEPERHVATAAALDGGHELTTVAGTEYAVVPTEAGIRVRLTSGAALFEVRPLEEGREFVVETADAEVHVVGTVFAVERAGGHTAVRTFEGRVRVVANGVSRELGPGGSWGVSRGGIASLAEGGRRAARERNSNAAPLPPRARRTVRAATREVAPPVAIATARRWISSGGAGRALDVATEREADDPEWGAVAADALRALGRWGEAAQRYDDVALSLGEAGIHYGLLAAQLRLRRLHDAEGAVHSIEVSGVHAPDSPLRERGLALLVEALHSAGDMPAFLSAADDYRSAFPHGSRRAWIDARRDSASASDVP